MLETKTVIKKKQIFKSLDNTESCKTDILSQPKYIHMKYENKNNGLINLMSLKNPISAVTGLTNSRHKYPIQKSILIIMKTIYHRNTSFMLR